MAIQFPNFLQAPIQQSDYSGIGNAMENYYAGYNMPKDALIKEIQAKFAQPIAEQTLLSSKLSNRKSQMDIDRLSAEIAQQREMEKQLRQVLSGGNSPSPLTSPMQANQAPNQPRPAFGGMTMIGSPPAGIPMPQAAPNMPTAPMSPMQQPIAPNAPAQSNPDSMNEVIVSKGSPQLAGIDMMYDNNPLSRAFLEKKGYKKTQEIKFDNKTGKTSIITKYPSGKVTVQTGGGIPPSDDGVPLTNKMITTHQRVISSVDNALPLLEKLKNMKNHSNIYFGGNATATHEQREYLRLVNAIKEKLIGAYALNPTEEGLHTATEQLIIGGRESEEDYKKSLDNLINEIKGMRQYSAKEVKRSNKIQPIDSSASDEDQSNNTYSNNEWEVI
ncbi:MAG TPA: hypothetical protein VJ279_08435 [Hanamia sp.]|jgi:hypothetical protein|nr:hypothetical protein [Hanamia sp.]